jgi:hypothetical protein
MNKDAFKHYESDIARAGGFKALPEMHQQAYEIIKEASSDFTDWDQLMAVAEEPDIQKLIEIHLEWLNQELSKTPVKSEPTVKTASKKSNTSKAKGVVFIRPGDRVRDNATKEEGTVSEIISGHVAIVEFDESGYKTIDLDNITKINKSKKRTTPKPNKQPKRKAKWWITKGTARERVEQLIEKMVDIRIDAFDEEEEVIASTEMEIRDLVESTGDLNRNVLEKIMAGWQEMIDIQSVNSVQDDLVKIGTELARIIKTLPKAKRYGNRKCRKRLRRFPAGKNGSPRMSVLCEVF